MKFDSEVVRFHLNCPHESRNQADCNTMLLAEVVATLKDVVSASITFLWGWH